MSIMSQNEEVEKLEQLYRNSVMMSQKIGELVSERLHMLPERESLNPDPVVYPPCIFRQYEIEGFPVYQLSYEGMLPLYSKENKFCTKLRDYYIRSTMEAIMGKEIGCLEHGFIYICHFFGNLVIRDLDNRNRRLLINAVRYAGFIRDDSWKEIEIMESGYLDVRQKNHVQVFITNPKNTVKLIERVKKNYRDGHDFSGSI
ncbi:hypothetical protein ABD76_28005 [Paenibacillus dendritiformis]|uniref:hypothetical protein n=1 Tax=Paenibacillus dendritiformis TaxID=130049 RepID=UPI0018CEAAF7|nr:hypothetical protein [Paenibacillus dendritiformis]MBG9796067.1 hypothetical protein [Paenibacillus dendritiformis]